MGGKKTEKDLLSDFFGDDDLDWLDEEEQNARAAAAAETPVEAPSEPEPDAPIAAAAPVEPPPPPPPPPTRAPTLPPQPAPELTGEASAATSAPVEPVEPESEFVAAPAEEAFFAAPDEDTFHAASLGDEDADADVFQRDPVDDTIGAFLEPMEGLMEGDPEALVTVTDATPRQPLEDIVVEEDRTEDIDPAVAPVEAAAAALAEEESAAPAEEESAAPAEEEEAAAEAEAAAPAQEEEAVAEAESAAPAVEEAAAEPVGEGVEAAAEEAPASEEAPAEPAEAHADEALAGATASEPEVDEAPVAEAVTAGSGPEDETVTGLSPVAREVETTPAQPSDEPEAVVEAPVAEAPTPSVSWTPPGEDEAWAAVVAAVESAMASADGEEKRILAVEAARIRRDRLGDVAGAVALLDGVDDADASVLEVRADSFLRSRDLAAAAEAMAARAERLEGPAAAESWQAAAMIARHRLQDLESAEARLRRAIEADPEDYASLSLLRDQLSVRGREKDRAEVLERISGVAAGRVAAEAWWELGRLQHRLGHEEAALAAYRKGREQDPSHAPCFLALQALYVASANDEALGELHLSEATREATREGAVDQHQWLIEAARAFVDARDTKRADDAFERAVQAGHPMARREQQAWYLATDRIESYVEALRQEAESISLAEGKAFAFFRLGRVLEKRGEPDAAVDAFREAVALDPAAGPAAEAVARSLHRAGRFEELLAFWEARQGSAEGEDVHLRASVLLRMAEVAEVGLSDEARARGYLERILEFAPSDRPALHALRRIYQRLEAWAELAGVRETLADLAQEPARRAQHLARAGTIWRYRVGDAQKALEAFGRALELVPHHAIALDEQVDLLEERGEWEAQALVLRAAADSLPDDADKARAAYQAGRVWLDRLDDPTRAGEAFRQSLRHRPGFLPALGMLKQLASRAGEGQEVYRLYLQQAEGLDDPAARAWRLLAASDLATDLPGGDAGRDLGAILERDPAHPGAVATQEIRLLTMGAKVGLLNLYRRELQGLEPGPRRSRTLVRVAGLFEALGDPSGVEEPLREALTAGVEGTPYRYLARLAEGQRHWASAAEALERSGANEDRLERARLLALRLDRSEDAVEAYAALLDESDVAVGAALASAALAQRAGDGALLLRAHALLAENAEPEAVRAAHALWSGQLAEAASEKDAALVHYRAALELRPASSTAFDGARRLLLAARDAEGLQALWSTRRPEDVHGLAMDLERVGAEAAIVSVWEEVLASTEGVAAIPVLARLELARAAVGDWQGVYGATSRRAALTSDAEVKASLDAKRRWLLAEKLSGTDEAWDLYRSLHEENPDDRDVTSALARIALARGETRMAISYLEALADGAETPAEAADLRVRTGEVHEQAGNAADARQAWLDALDHVPDHEPALTGLKRLATEQEDWGGLLAVLKREAGLLEGEAKRDALVAIATTTQERLDDPALAMDAWRAVLDAAPGHAEALAALLALAEKQQDWEAFVQTGTAVAEQREGAERTALLARLGDVSVDTLGREDGFKLWERAISEGEADRGAAERLVQHYRSMGDTSNTLRTLIALAEVSEPAEAGRLFADAGTLEAEVRHDREAAAGLYERALEGAPEEPRALRFMADYAFEHGRAADALPLFERLAPTVEEGQDLDDFDARMELSTFWFRLARMLVDAMRPDEALEPARKALTYNANHEPTLELVAPLYIGAEAWDDANEVLRTLLQLIGGRGDKARMADLYAQLGMVEHALGRLDKASKRYAKAMDLVQHHVPALLGMAKLLLEREEWSALLNVYNNIIYHAPEPADVTAAYLAKGRLLDEQMGRADKAAQHYERSLVFDANQPKALLRLAELAWRRKDWSEVSALAQRGLALAVHPGPLRADLLLCVAAARTATHDEERATAAFAEARTADPERELADDAMSDLESLREQVQQRLPI